MLLITTSFLHSYPHAAYCEPYSCQANISLNMTFTNIEIFGQINTGPMDIFVYVFV